MMCITVTACGGIEKGHFIGRFTGVEPLYSEQSLHGTAQDSYMSHGRLY